MPKTRTKIVQDDFTKRLLITHLAIIKRGEIRFKKNFSDAIKISSSFFWQIQEGTHNYPPGKQDLAKSGLLEKYGVNPTYLMGNSETQFVREARPIKRAVKEDAVKTNFANKNTKQVLLNELAAKEMTIKKQEQRIVELEQQLLQAAEPRVNYREPDNKSDKTNKK